jgi:hypothetical protein
MDERRNPDTYLPGALELFWLISESPRGELLFDDWHGRATAEEVARTLWPVDTHVPVSYLNGHSMNGLTPTQWVTAILDHEAKPCVAGGMGRITKDGDDYIVSVASARLMLRPESPTMQAGNGRPYNLPKWRKN